MVLRNNLDSTISTLTSKGYNITCVYDIGANKGKWTAAYEPKLRAAQFFLFEANPNHHRPKRLAPKHKWFNVVLSDPDTTEVDFYSTGGTGDSYYKERTQHYDNCATLKLATTTLDSLVKTKSLPLPQLIKMDTQGSELDILRGAKTVIEHADIVMIEMPVLSYNRGAPSFDDYMAFFLDREFVPLGLEGAHFGNNMLVQIDIVFLRKSVKVKYYGDNKVFEA